MTTINELVHLATANSEAPGQRIRKGRGWGKPSLRERPASVSASGRIQWNVAADVSRRIILEGKLPPTDVGGHTVHGPAALVALLCLGLLAACFCANLKAQPNAGGGKRTAVTGDPAAAARRVFHEAQTLYRNEPRNGQAAWQFGRACFDLAEFASDSAERAELAEQGIAACQQLLEREPNLAPAHYYLGMNLGQLARTKGIGALKLVKQMEIEFSLARERDKTFDYAGPDRNLGLLYRDAPSIGSIGSRTKAKQHLEISVELAPDYPENRLNLAEAFLKWNDRNGAKRELKALDEDWSRARAKFSGPAWAASWGDWEKRRQNVRKKLEELSKPLESPRQKK